MELIWSHGQLVQVDCIEHRIQAFADAVAPLLSGNSENAVGSISQVVEAVAAQACMPLSGYGPSSC